MKGKQLLTGILIAAAAAGVMAGIGYAVVRTTSDSKAVKVISVRENSENISAENESVSYEGVVSGEAAQQIYVNGTAAVESVLVSEGQEVREGDTILIYDTAETGMNLKRLEIEQKRLALRIEVAEKNIETLNGLYPYYEGYGYEDEGDYGGGEEEFDEEDYLESIAEGLAGLDDEQLEKTLIKTLAKLNAKETVKLLNMLMEDHRGNVLKKVIAEMTPEKQSELLTEIAAEEDEDLMELYLSSFTDSRLSPVLRQSLLSMDKASVLWTCGQMQSAGRTAVFGDSIARMDGEEQKILVSSLSRMSAEELSGILNTVSENTNERKLTKVLSVSADSGKSHPVRDFLSAMRTKDGKKYAALLNGLNPSQKAAVVRACGEAASADPETEPTPTEELEASPTPTEEPEAEPTPTEEPEETPVPTEEPEPTEAPAPTEEPSPEPVQTPDDPETGSEDEVSSFSETAEGTGVSLRIVRTLLIPGDYALAGGDGTGGSGLIRPDSQYSPEELEEARQEAADALEELKLQERELNLKKAAAEKALSEGKVCAKYDGVVTRADDPEEHGNSEEPLVTVIGNAGTFISGEIGEVELETVKEGGSCMVMDYMTGGTYTGRITEISEFPSRTAGAGDSAYEGANSSQSYYPMTVVIEDREAQLEDGSWVSIVPVRDDADSGEGSDRICMWKAFFIQEDGRNYAYVRGEDGKLTRREVRLGKLIWDYYYEVREGLSMDDWIAFPYGNAAEGAETEESTMSGLYEE